MEPIPRRGPVHIATPEIERLDPASNLTDLVVNRLGADPARTVYSIPRGDDLAALSWEEVTAFEFLERVRDIAKGLIASGVRPGDMIAVMSATSYQWALVDQAIWFAGAISVPIYETSSPSQVAQMSAASNAATVFVVGSCPARALSRAIETYSLFAIHQLELAEAGLYGLAFNVFDVSDADVETALILATMNTTATVV